MMNFEYEAKTKQYNVTKSSKANFGWFTNAYEPLHRTVSSLGWLVGWRRGDWPQ